MEEASSSVSIQLRSVYKFHLIRRRLVLIVSKLLLELSINGLATPRHLVISIRNILGLIWVGLPFLLALLFSRIIYL